MQLHEKIKVLRELNKWTQEEMAHRLNMSISGYGSIERGESNVNFSRLGRIVEAFGMNMFEFLSFGEGTSVSQTNSSRNFNHHFGQFYNSKFKGNSGERVEQLELLVQQKDHEIEYLKQHLIDLKQQILDLREMNSLLKKEK